MREILFRGKRVDNGKWVEGFYAYTYRKHRIYPITNNSVYLFYEVIPETVGQFTGLKDNHGKAICEDDIVRVPEFYETPEMTNTSYRTWLVVFRHGAYYLNETALSTDSYTLAHEIKANDGDCEVVGVKHPKSDT